MKISICIPTYNQSGYLIQAINSASNQSLMPYEIIVSDDCSTDDTLEVLQALSEEIPELKIIRQPVNLGIAGNTDACLRMATGIFVVRLDSDDYLSPFFCEKLASLLNNYPEAGYAHAAVQEIDQNGVFLRRRWLARKTGFQSSPEALRAAIKGYRVAANIIMFRKSALVKLNYNTGRPDYVEDYHLNASLSAAGFGNVYLNEALSFYRVWVDAAQTRQRRKMLEINGLRRVFVEVLEPEFEKRGWVMTSLLKSKKNIACTQSDCLSWNVYSKKEKEELRKALLALSSASKVHLYIWLYLKGYGKGLDLIGDFKNSVKSNLKLLFFPFKSYKIG